MRGEEDTDVVSSWRQWTCLKDVSEGRETEELPRTVWGSPLLPKSVPNAAIALCISPWGGLSQPRENPPFLLMAALILVNSVGTPGIFLLCASLVR